MANNALAKPSENRLASYLKSDAVKRKLTEAAGQFMRPEDLVRFTLLAASRSPKLLECTPESVLRALMDAAELKIKPGGLMGRGYLVPRYNNKIGAMEACFDPGWRGLVDIARRSGKIKRIEAHVVHENDRFRYVCGLAPVLEHEPTLDGDPGAIKMAYAIAEMVDGSVQVEVVTRADLEKIRDTSAAKSGPWVDWPDEMCRKSAVRRLCKYLPFDDALDHAMELATAVDAPDLPEAAGQTAPRLLAKLKATSIKAEEPDEEGVYPDPPAAPEAAPVERERVPGEDDV
jgi:recombination protein RecT